MPADAGPRQLLHAQMRILAARPAPMSRVVMEAGAAIAPAAAAAAAAQV